MKKKNEIAINVIKFCSCLFAIGAIGLTAACQAVQEHRAQQFQSELNEISSSMAQLAKRGIITHDMPPVAVYVALGSPEYTHQIEDESVLWVYWGTWPEDQEIEDDRITFLSRSDARIPTPGEEREELHLTFENGRLSEWRRDPLTDKDLRHKRSVPYGTLPEIP